MLFRRTVTVWICAALLTAAQTPVPSSDQPLTLRSTTRLVQISVVAHDRVGKPIRDLKKEDFVVTEKGKPQTISLFSMETIDAQPMTRPSAPLEPGVVTNLAQEKSGAPNSVSVILLDALNTKRADQFFARDQVVRFLQTLHPQDRVSLYALGNGLRVLHEFTTDSSSILRRLSKYNGQFATAYDGSQSVLPNTNDAELDKFLEDSERRITDFYTTRRVEATCAALEAIAQRLGQVPGRKNLIWVSGSFPLQIGMDEVLEPGDTRDRRMFTEEMERAIRAVNQANMAIYPVDARGLSVGTSFQDASVSGARAARQPPPASLKPIVENLDTLKYLADRTGGRAFYNTNDLSKAIRSAIDDSEVTYTLGFYPADEKTDRKFHELKVHSLRKGVNLRYRKGYFALPDEVPEGKQRTSMIRDAIASPLDAAAVGMSARVVPTPKGQPDDLSVVMRIDARNLRLTPAGDRTKGQLTIVFAQLDEQGKSLDGVKKEIGLNLTADRLKVALTQGMTLVQQVKRQPKMAQMRIVVLDDATGNLGSLRIAATQILPLEPAP